MGQIYADAYTTCARFWRWPLPPNGSRSWDAHLFDYPCRIHTCPKIGFLSEKA